jgi:hypothetical protein
MRSIICAVLSGGIAIAGLTPAFAQETYRDEPYYQYNEPYYDMDPDDDDDEGVVVRPTDCGEFRYWNGERCVDARALPPAIR